MAYVQIGSPLLLELSPRDADTRIHGLGLPSSSFPSHNGVEIDRERERLLESRFLTYLFPSPLSFGRKARLEQTLHVHDLARHGRAHCGCSEAASLSTSEDAWNVLLAAWTLMLQSAACSLGLMCDAEGSRHKISPCLGVVCMRRMS